MKKAILLFILISGFAFGQNPDKFEMIDTGMTDFIVTNIPDKSATEIYSKTIEWINKTYDTPKEVIKGNVTDNYVRFQGTKKLLSCWQFMGSKMCYDSKYNVEISVKDGKYKFDVIDLERFIGLSKDYPTGWRKDTFSTKGERFNKKGEIKTKYQYEHEIPDYFNSLNESLKNYIINGEKENNENW